MTNLTAARLRSGKRGHLLVAGVAIAAAVGGFAPTSGRAQTFFWTGGGANSNFSTPENWQGNLAPPSSPTTNLVFGTSRNYSPRVDDPANGSFIVNSFVFNPSSGAYGLGSATNTAFNFAGAGGSTITQNAVTQTAFSNPLVLSTQLTINGSGVGNLLLSGISGTSGLTIDQAGQLAQTGAISSGLFSQVPGPLLGGSQVVLSSPNTFTGDVILKNGNLVLNGAASLGSANNRLLVQAGNSSLRLTGGTVANNVVVDGGASLTYTGGSGTLSGVISGAGGLRVFGQTGSSSSGLAALTLTNAQTYTGATILNYGSSGDQTFTGLTLSGAAGSLLSTSQINVVYNTTLSLNNTGGTYLSDRVSDTAPIFLTGGRISYGGQGTTLPASTEIFGALNLNGGFNILTFNPNNRLTFAQLNAPVDKGTLLVLGLAGGTPTTANSTVVFTNASGLVPISAPGSSGTGIFTGIIPFMAGSTTQTFTGEANTFVTYDANGLRLLNPTLATDFAQISGSTLATNANNAVTGGFIEVNVNQRINSLLVNGANGTSFRGTGTLQVYSGAVATARSSADFIETTLDFGSNTGYFYVDGPIRFLGNGQITGSGGVVVGAEFSRTASTLTLNNSRPSGQTGAINPFTGGLFVNGNATVAFNSDSQLGAAGGAITLNGGTLDYINFTAGTLDATRTLRIGTVAGSLGKINVGSGAMLTIPSAITGAGDMVKTGTGTLVLTGTNTNTGSLIASAGVLRFNSTSALPLGGIVSQGGVTLQPLNSMTLTAPLTLTGLAGTSSVGTTTLNIASGQTLTLAGALNGSPTTAALSLTGAGTLRIVSNAAYSGQINVTNGTLSVSGSLNPAASVTVGSSAFLVGSTLSGGVCGSVVVGTQGGGAGGASNGVVAPGDGGTGVFGTLNLQSLQINNGGVLRYDLDLSSSTSDKIVIAQVFNKGLSTDRFFLDFNLTGTSSGVQTYTLATFDNSFGPTNPVTLADISVRGLNGYNSQLAFDASARNLLLTLSSGAAATPEPNSLAFLLLVLPGAGGVWAKRARKQG